MARSDSKGTKTTLSMEDFDMKDTDMTVTDPNYNQRLCAAIAENFISQVKEPVVLMRILRTYNRNVLTEADFDYIKTLALNKGPMAANQELLERLHVYQNWFQCLVQGLKDENINLGFLANTLQQTKEKLFKQICSGENETSADQRSDNMLPIMLNFERLGEKQDTASAHLKKLHEDIQDEKKHQTNIMTSFIAKLEKFIAHHEEAKCDFHKLENDFKIVNDDLKEALQMEKSASELLKKQLFEEKQAGLRLKKDLDDVTKFSEKLRIELIDETLSNEELKTELEIEKNSRLQLQKDLDDENMIIQQLIGIIDDEGRACKDINNKQMKDKNASKLLLKDLDVEKKNCIGRIKKESSEERITHIELREDLLEEKKTLEKETEFEVNYREQLKKKLEEQKEARARLEEELEKEIIKIKELQNHLNKQRETTKELNIDLINENNAKERLRKELEKEECSNRRVKTKIAVQKNEHDELKKNVISEKHTCEGLKNDLEKEKNERQKLTKELREANHDCEILRKILMNERDDIQKLRNELKNARKDMGKVIILELKKELGEETNSSEHNILSEQRIRPNMGRSISVEDNANKNFITNNTSLMGGRSSVNDNKFTLFLMGRTGAGKSATGNSIVGRQCFRISPSPRRYLWEATRQLSKFEYVSLEIIDGPGYHPLDPYHRYLSDMRQIAIHGVHVFLYVIKYANGFDDADIKFYRALKEKFGADFIQDYCIVVFTAGDVFRKDERDHNIKFVEWCAKQEGPLKELIDESAGVVLFDNRTADKDKNNKQMRCLIRLMQQNTSRRLGAATFQFPNFSRQSKIFGDSTLF